MTNPFFQKFVIYPVDEAKSAVETGQAAEMEPQYTVPLFQGNNQKQLLLVFKAAETEQVELSTFLEKVIQAVGYQLNEDACQVIFRRTDENILIWEMIIQQQPAKHAIFFGLTPTELGITTDKKPFEVFDYEASSLLFAPDLKQIYVERKNGQKENAAKLWQSMKTMFKLN